MNAEIVFRPSQELWRMFPESNVFLKRVFYGIQRVARGDCSFYKNTINTGEHWLRLQQIVRFLVMNFRVWKQRNGEFLRLQTLWCSSALSSTKPQVSTDSFNKKVIDKSQLRSKRGDVNIPQCCSKRVGDVDGGRGLLRACSNVVLLRWPF